jgi:ubiquinone/menaquinone biosynthesis C-methylase UbiE
MKIKQYIEKNSDYLDNNPDWHLSDSPYKSKVIINLIEQEKLKPKTIIDVGCGYGAILKSLQDHFPKEIIFKGFDVSPDAISYAKKFEYNNLSFVHGNFTEFNDNCDLLLMIDVFEHIPDYLKFINENVRKSQYSIFHIPLDFSIESIIRKSYLWTREKFGHLHYFTSDLAIEILQDLNLDVLRVVYTSELDLPRSSIGSKIAYPFRRLFELVLGRRISSIFLGGYSIMVLVKNKNLYVKK